MKTLLVAALFFIAACHKPEPAAESPTPSVQQQRAERAAEVPASTQRQWTFLNRIRQEDAFNGALHRTMLNEQNELGVVLYSTVALESVPDLMRQVMTEMGKEFPNEAVTVAVYQVAVPPKRIGTAQLDAQTGEATFIPAK